MTISNCVRTIGLALCVATPLLVWGEDFSAVRLTPDELKWKPIQWPKGLEITELVGSRSQPGPFVERLKFPPNFTHYPHFHPDDRSYVVISGTLYVGYGERLDPAKLKALPAGSFHTEPAKMPHFLVTKGEGAIIQVTGTGTSGTTFIDPVDAEAKRQQGAR